VDLLDDPKSEHLSVSQNADTTSNVSEMKTRYHRRTLRMMVDKLNINKETIHQMLHEDLQKLHPIMTRR
jgi:flagellar motor component MotA